MINWNGFLGFYKELGIERRSLLIGTTAFWFEHILVGLLLPMNYLYGKQFNIPYGGDIINFKLLV